VRPILIASNNKHKVGEFEELFRESIHDLARIVTPDSLLKEKLEVEENGTSFGENAAIKAKAFFKAGYMPTFADDSGLEVDILDGAPGIHSARYAGEHGDDVANRHKLIDELKKRGLERTPARFVCVICYIDGEMPSFSKGVCEGYIITEERGEGGFGYDPIFVPDGYDKTFAELSSEIKNKISHRAIAAKKFISYLKMKLA
jgi:XTP/dITP diphosphohydrolase